MLENLLLRTVTGAFYLNPSFFQIQYWRPLILCKIQYWAEKNLLNQTLINQITCNDIITSKSLIVGSNGSKAMQVCLNENIGEFIFKLEENQEDIEDGGSSFTICIFNLLETLDKIFPDDENLVYSENLKKVAEYHSSGKDKVERNIRL